MKLHSLAIEGLLAFSDRVELNLDDIPAGSLISIVGENGSGKSTLMDAAMASLYRTLPSRPRSLYDYAHPGGGSIEAVWSTDPAGHIAIRFRLEFDPNRRTSRGVIVREATDLSDALVLTDGKVENYSNYVSRYFPPLPVVLASSYAAQSGKGSFRTLDRTERKDLFTKLLGLDRFPDWQSAARIHQNAAESSADYTRQEVARTEVIVENRTWLTTGLEEHRAVERHSRGQSEAVAAELATAREEHTAAAAALTALNERRRAHLQWFDLDQEFVSRIIEQNAAIETRRKSKANREAELTVTLRRVQDGADQATALIEQAEPPLTDVTPLREALDAATEKEFAAEGVVDARETHWRRSGKRVEVTEALEDDAALRHSVPCEMKKPYDGCGFLTKAKLAANVLDGSPSSSELRTTLQQAETVLNEARHDFTAARSAVAELRTTLQQAEFTRSAEAEKHNAWMRDQGRAHASLDTLEDRRADIRDQFDREQRAEDQAIIAATDRLTELTNRRAAHHAGRVHHVAAVSTVEAQAAHVERTSECVDRLVVAHTTAVHAAGEASGTVRSCEANLAATEGSETMLKTEREELAVRTRDETEWRFIADAFSRNGLSVLLIDAAGPEISELTNDLLHASFGDRFRVALLTQTAKASGKGMKETFELSVFDAETGGDRELTDLSGGQQVIVDEALKAALALYTARRADHGSKTCFRDETTGALDGENVDRYISMLRRLQDLGGYDHLIYVTHSAEAAAKADWTVRVADGAIEVGEN